MTSNDDERALLPFDEAGSDRLIRRQWHDGRWHFSVVDVVGVLTDAASPRTYWAQLKAKLSAEGADETLQTLKQLKMRALDGKLRETDAADVEVMLRIVQSVPSPKAEPIKAWLAREGARRLGELPEDQRRQLVRGEVAERNVHLAGTVQSAGVISGRDFAVFQDFGYRGLYAGETARDIAARKGLAKGERILDWMGSEELAANLFRITQTEAKIAREGIDNKGDANRTHHDVGRAVRATIAELGGTMPEDLPTPAESIQQLQRREEKRLEAQRQPGLFAADGDGEGE